jgi:hypothetical protein
VVYSEIKRPGKGERRMNEKETGKRITLLERELSVLAEDLDKNKMEMRSDLDSMRLEVESLKTILTQYHRDFQGTFKKIKTQTLMEKNPEWMSGQP